MAILRNEKYPFLSVRGGTNVDFVDGIAEVSDEVAARLDGWEGIVADKAPVPTPKTRSSAKK